MDGKQMLMQDTTTGSCNVSDSWETELPPRSFQQQFPAALLHHIIRSRTAFISVCHCSLFYGVILYPDFSTLAFRMKLSKLGLWFIESDRIGYSLLDLNKVHNSAICIYLIMRRDSLHLLDLCTAVPKIIYLRQSIYMHSYNDTAFISVVHPSSR